MNNSIESSVYRSEGSAMMDLSATRSPFSTLIIIVLSVFVCETIVMIIISFLPAFSVFIEILFDSTLLMFCTILFVTYLFLNVYLSHNLQELLNHRLSFRLRFNYFLFRFFLRQVTDSPEFIFQNFIGE
ncbi:hypothetical protein LCGC14_2624370 [marine sediment metagenome]|uniref:Uncharacterized protein n=1 Tax=marine sediment metagenome TaxID=412755 RepID=A0A0F9CUL6_9ZZZZ